MSALREVDRLEKAYDGVTAVRDVSLTLARDELLALVGPNGAGTRTCFNPLNGPIRPNSRAVRREGRDVTGLPPARMFRLGVRRTFQITATFGSMSVRENVAVATPSHADQLSRFCGALRADAEPMLDLVGMNSQAERLAAELAYGDLKRVELAVALAGEPRLLLMDEPTAGMAPEERAELMALTVRLARARGLGALFTEHDMNAVFAHADRVMVLSRGELIAEGPPAQVRRDPQVRTVYLDEGRVHAAEAASSAPGLRRATSTTGTGARKFCSI